MNKGDIATSLRYNRWANEALLQSAGRLSREAFFRDLRSSHGSVRNTLTHILWGEWIWLQRWHGKSSTEVFNPANYQSVERLQSAWEPVQEGQLRFLDRISDGDLDQIISYRNLQNELWQYPLRQMFQHVVNHSTYHRGQVVTLLRQLEVIPPPTDFLVFVDRSA